MKDLCQVRKRVGEAESRMFCNCMGWCGHTPVHTYHSPSLSLFQWLENLWPHDQMSLLDRLNTGCLDIPAEDCQDGSGIKNILSQVYCKRGHKVWCGWKPVSNAEDQHCCISISVALLYEYVNWICVVLYCITGITLLSFCALGITLQKRKKIKPIEAYSSISDSFLWQYNPCNKEASFFCCIGILIYAK